MNNFQVSATCRLSDCYSRTLGTGTVFTGTCLHIFNFVFLNTVDVHMRQSGLRVYIETQVHRLVHFTRLALTPFHRRKNSNEGNWIEPLPLQPYLRGYGLQVVVCVAEG